MFYVVHLDHRNIELLQLKINLSTVKYSILTATPKLKLLPSNIEIVSNSFLKITPNDSLPEDAWYQMHTIGKRLPGILVMGLQTINKVVIHQKDIPDESTGEKSYELLVEGTNMQQVLATYGIKATECTSNSILEVREVLGVEGARATIIDQIGETMGSHGLKVDWRHLNLISDHMTCKGSVQGFTRHGSRRVKESVLTLASFENTDVHLFNAAFHGQVNEICGVTDCIVTGQPIDVGTGVFKLLEQHKRNDSISPDFKLNEEQLECLSMREQISKLRTVSEDTVRLGILKPRPLLFDIEKYHPFVDFSDDV